MSILDTAKGNANLSTLVAVAQFASDNNDLVNLLANPGTSTVFAPSKAAFEALAKELTGSATATDVLTSNGVIHAIGRVMLPSL